MMSNLSNAFGKGFLPGKVHLDRDAVIKAMRERRSELQVLEDRLPGAVAQRVAERLESLRQPSGLAEC